MERKVETVPDSQIIAKPAADVGAADHIAQHNRFKAMERRFAEMPRETVRIREEDGSQFVQINTYSFSIGVGTPVKVPVQVADMLREKGVI